MINAAILAQATQDQSSLLVNILVPLIPWLVIFGFVWVIMFFTLRRAHRMRARTEAMMEQSERHLNAIDDKLSKVIALLEQQINGKQLP